MVDRGKVKKKNRFTYINNYQQQPKQPKAYTKNWTPQEITKKLKIFGTIKNRGAPILESYNN